MEGARQAQEGGGVGRAAAKAGGNGQVFFEPDRLPAEVYALLAQDVEGTLEDIGTPDGVGKRPAHAHSPWLAGRNLQAIGDRGEGHETFQFVVAVAAPPQHLE